MLYQAIYVAYGKPSLSRDILMNPEITRYVEQWGKSGDFGYKVLMKNHRSPVGAIWVRILNKKNKRYGYVNDDTQELAMSVNKEFRNKGLGTLLLTNLFSCLSDKGIKSVSLSVSMANPARSLYKRFGFTDVGSEYDDSITMIKAL